MSATAFHLQIISPSAILVDAEVPTVEIPGAEGDFGVLPGHSALFSMIRPGIINVTLGDGAHRKFFVASGYADVTPDRCTVISDQIEDLSAVTTAKADEAFALAKAAQAKAGTDLERRNADKLLQTAEAMAAAVKAH